MEKGAPASFKSDFPCAGADLSISEGLATAVRLGAEEANRMSGANEGLEAGIMSAESGRQISPKVSPFKSSRRTRNGGRAVRTVSSCTDDVVRPQKEARNPDRSSPMVSQTIDEPKKISTENA